MMALLYGVQYKSYADGIDCKIVSKYKIRLDFDAQFKDLIRSVSSDYRRRRSRNADSSSQ